VFGSPEPHCRKDDTHPEQSLAQSTQPAMITLDAPADRMSVVSWSKPAVVQSVLTV
jgi:hypothetical protein